MKKWIRSAFRLRCTITQGFTGLKNSANQLTPLGKSLSQEAQS